MEFVDSIKLRNIAHMKEDWNTVQENWMTSMAEILEVGWNSEVQSAKS